MINKTSRRRTATTGIILLIAGMSFSLVGCSVNGNTAHAVPPVNSSTSNGTPANQAPKEAPVGIGIIGSGQQVKTADGSTYETLTIAPDAPLYRFNNGQGLSPDMVAANYTVTDGQASQKLVADYMVKEFIDSTALETKDAGLQQWLGVTGRNYLSAPVYNDVAANPQGGGQVILGDLGSMKTIPNLLHDGKPREKNVSVSLADASLFSNDRGDKGIKYSVQYSATYRLSAMEAANFAGKLGGITADEFLKSARAQPGIKDGKGETTYTAHGTVDIVVDKDSSKDWRITGIMSKTDYDISAFVNNS